VNGPASNASTEVTLPARVSLAALLGPHHRGGGDPALRIDTDRRVAWRTSLTPDGPVTVQIRMLSDGDPDGTAARAEAWGSGARWALDQVPALLGARDVEPARTFRPLDPIVERLHRQGPPPLIGRTDRLLEALVPAILEQKVTGMEARRSWRRLITDYGIPAPGPAPEGMRVPPDGPAWATIPSWAWHRAGVGPERARAIVEAARRSTALERLDLDDVASVNAALRSLPRIGAWTSAEVRLRACGDADAVSVGDFHVARNVVHTFTGRDDGDDEAMLTLLAPYAGHRARVVKLVERSGTAPQRKAARYSPLDHRTR
jgi:3-methyladenine DNA glycosylase/8-oxoguanine DNA glycosylase